MGKYLDLLEATRDISDISDESCSKSCSQPVSRNRTDTFGRFGRFGRTLAELERRVPKQVTPEVWQAAIEDGRRFLAEWGPQAEGLGWTSSDLFGLHTLPDNPNLNQANKLSRTFATLLEALNRHRGKGQQKVTVEHVHVHAGGQAVVGMVETPGGGDRAKLEDQTHAKQITHAPQPAMWSADTEREPVPITGDAERTLSNARGDVAGRSEG